MAVGSLRSRANLAMVVARSVKAEAAELVLAAVLLAGGSSSANKGSGSSPGSIDGDEQQVSSQLSLASMDCSAHGLSFKPLGVCNRFTSWPSNSVSLSSSPKILLQASALRLMPAASII